MKGTDVNQIYEYDADVVVFESIERNIKYIDRLRVSAVACSCESEENIKKISIVKAIPKAEGYRVIVEKRDAESDQFEKIDEYSLTDTAFFYQVSSNETGVFSITVLDEKNNVIEKNNLPY